MREEGELREMEQLGDGEIYYRGAETWRKRE